MATLKKLGVVAGLCLAMVFGTGCASGRMCTPAQGAVVGGVVGGVGGAVIDGGMAAMIGAPVGAAVGAGICHFAGSTGSKTVDFYRRNHEYSTVLDIEAVCRQRYTEEVNLRLYTSDEARERFKECVRRAEADQHQLTTEVPSSEPNTSPY